MLIEASGLALIWLAPSQLPAALGALLTGLGFRPWSIPGLGVEAVRRAPPHSRGLVWALTPPFLTWRLDLAAHRLDWSQVGPDWNRVFLAGALLVLGAAIVALRLLCAPDRDGRTCDPMNSRRA